jgi:sterol 24-C-methyltransferase/phosphoethanolamine N-methyltransferase
MSEKSLADMPPYTNLDRIARGLSARGIGGQDAIPPEQLFDLDQWHYHGIDAIRAAADRLGLGPTSRVLDIGSGVGGPTRYLAHTIAVE